MYFFFYLHPYVFQVFCFKIKLTLNEKFYFWNVLSNTHHKFVPNIVNKSLQLSLQLLSEKKHPNNSSWAPYSIPLSQDPLDELPWNDKALTK